MVIVCMYPFAPLVGVFHDIIIIIIITTIIPRNIVATTRSKWGSTTEIKTLK